MNGRTWIKGVVHIGDDAVGREAWNVDGSANDYRYEEIGKSWICFWERLTFRRRSVCSYEDCDQHASCGGHVWIRKKGIHIVPICASCNHCDNEHRMQSDDNTSLLRRGTLAVAIVPTCDMIYAERRFVAMRSCQKCGTGISDRPENHILCFRCFCSRTSIKSSRRKRTCQRCRADISDRPKNYALCFRCFLCAN